MSRTSSPILLVAALFAAFAALLIAARVARAHGDAAWIMANPAYLDSAGVHCCGPTDCHREHASKLREAPEGIYLATGAGDEVLMPRSLVGRGLYPSIDDNWWVCVMGGRVKCIFKPTTGT